MFNQNFYPSVKYSRDRLKLRELALTVSLISATIGELLRNYCSHRFTCKFIRFQKPETYESMKRYFKARSVEFLECTDGMEMSYQIK